MEHGCVCGSDTSYSTTSESSTGFSASTTSSAYIGLSCSAVSHPAGTYSYRCKNKLNRLTHNRNLRQGTIRYPALVTLQWWRTCDSVLQQFPAIWRPVFLRIVWEVVACCLYGVFWYNGKHRYWLVAGDRFGLVPYKGADLWANEESIGWSWIALLLCRAFLHGQLWHEKAISIYMLAYCGREMFK